MKGIFIILDGVADLPCTQLNNQTPLEAAKTPNLDKIAHRSQINYCFPIRENIAPESHKAILSLLGYNPTEIQRGPLEALGANIKILPGDLALRTNFATIDDLESRTILDRRAGRTLSTKEAKILANTINKNLKLPYKFEFRPTIQHRGVLILRGGFSDNITNVDPGYAGGLSRSSASEKLNFSHSADDEDDSRIAAELLNNFVRSSHHLLDKHPLNQKRARKGLYAANIILCRDAGNKPVRLKKIKGKWIALAYMPLEKGIAKATNMAIYTFKYPKLKNINIYATLDEGLKKATKYARKMLKKYKNKYDFFFIHIKETDLPGHDNKPHEKVKMIEFIDEQLFSNIAQILEKNPNTKLLLTADHTTACTKKAHTSDPVPVLFYNPQKQQTAKHRFTEKHALRGKKIYGQSLLESTILRKGN